MKQLFTAALIFLTLAGAAGAAQVETIACTSGTLTITTTTPFAGVTVKDFAWACDAGGNVLTDYVLSLNGLVLKLITDPEASDAPTDNYDIAITDAHGADILAGAGADRDTTTTEQVVPMLLDAGGARASLVPAGGLYKFAVTNAGNTTSGTAQLWFGSWRR